MPRVKRGTTSTRKRKSVLKHTKGFMWGRKSKERLAKEALLHAWVYAFRDRRNKKRDFRRLWNVKINAAARKGEMKYSTFMAELKKKNISLNRKVLAEIAEENPEVFQKIVEEVKN